MPKFHSWIGVILLIFLAGCTTSAPSVPVDMEIVTIQRSPVLGWMGSAMNQCAFDSGIQLLVEEQISREMKLEGADLSISWGEPETFGAFSITLGMDSLVVIVHPDNPLVELTLEQVQNLFAGEVRSWQPLLQECETCTSASIEAVANLQVNMWIYPDGHEFQVVGDDILLKGSKPYPTAHLAASPEMMLDQVAGNSSAIGLISASWLNDRVKAVSVRGLPENATRLPIVVTSMSEPSEKVKTWLYCLQGAIATTQN